MTDDLLAGVESHLVAALGPVQGRAAVTFVGTDRFEVLRLGGPGVFRYATLGMSRHPMTDPAQVAPDLESAPRAELVLSLAEPRDDVFRALAVLAACPFVEGLVLRAGASLDLGEPLWRGGGCTSVLVAACGGLVPSWRGVDFFPVLPMTAAEAAWKRAHGAAALEERWLAAGAELRDPERRAVALT